MKRRDFFNVPFTAAAFASMAQGADSIANGHACADRGFRVSSGQDRNDGSLLIMGGRFDLKVSGKDTGGDLCIYDTVRSIKGGPPLHLHQTQDEWFYVIRGEFIAKVGSEKLRLGPGDSAFAARNIPHTFALSSAGAGRMLVLFQPAVRMEASFRAMSDIGKDVSASRGIPKELWEECGMKLLESPLEY